MEQFQDGLKEIIGPILDVEFVDPEDQAVINQELNSKELALQAETEDGIVVTFTRDGIAYWDRNGDGAADVKTRHTPVGMQYDTGDGTGWRFFPPDNSSPTPPPSPFIPPLM